MLRTGSPLRATTLAADFFGNLFARCSLRCLLDVFLFFIFIFFSLKLLHPNSSLCCSPKDRVCVWRGGSWLGKHSPWWCGAAGAARSSAYLRVPLQILLRSAFPTRGAGRGQLLAPCSLARAVCLAVLPAGAGRGFWGLYFVTCCLPERANSAAPRGCPMHGPGSSKLLWCSSFLTGGRLLFLARANLEPQIGLRPILSPLWEQRLLPQPTASCWTLSAAGLGRARGGKPQLLRGVTRGLAEECEQFGTSRRYRGRLSPHQQGSERGRVHPAAQHPHPFPGVPVLGFFFPKCVAGLSCSVSLPLLPPLQGDGEPV